MIESPIGSPIVYRRTRESDTGTDEDNVQLDSPASSDSLFQAREDNEKAMECVHAANSAETSKKPCCHNCGATPTQYIPIPVPVPIPFPVWATPQDTVMLYGADGAGSRLRSLPRSLWPYVSQAALIWPLINAGEPHGALHNNSDERGAHIANDMPAAANRNSASQSAEASSAINDDQTEEPAEDKLADDSAARPALEPAEEELTGYLECENRDVSSSDSSGDSSDSSDTSGNRKPRVRRVYNVNGGDGRQSDDALPSSNVTSDCDEEDGRVSHSSVREDDMSSSGSADTDSDDTGTVADQKPKRFSRIFVVNKNVSSSSNASTSSDSDTSDNDTDTEMDCTVILTNVKHLDAEAPFESASVGAGSDKQITGDNVDRPDANNNPNCDNQIGDSRKLSERDLREELSKVLPAQGNKGTTPDPKVNGKEVESMSSSPGLSDVSAESLNSSDVEQVRGYSDETPREPEGAALAETDVRPSSGERNSAAKIRSGEAGDEEGEAANTPCDGEQAGGPVLGESEVCLSRNAARYTSLVMITQEPAPNYQQVSVVTSDTTTLVADNDVVVRHTNWQDEVRNEEKCNGELVVFWR